MPKGFEKSLWDNAIEHANSSPDDAQTGDDAAVFIVGSKNVGKTSLILRFLDREEAPKPTVALEYTFGRRAKGHNIAKDVGHIWELGGGTSLSKLLDIPINPDTIQHITLVIVLDLSKPKELWFTLETILSTVKTRIEMIVQEMKQTHPSLKEDLKKRAWDVLGNDHVDKNMIEPFLIPLVIIGGKYDLFQDFESDKRKVVCKTLRFVAHSYGASLQFFSTRQEQLVTKTRATISHHLFATGLGKGLQTEYNKPLHILAGQDSFQQIGSPPVSDGDLGKISARNPMELWKLSYCGYFPQQNMADPALVEDPAKDPQYAEPAIDSLRKQKDEELERYRKLCERRNKRNIFS